MDLALVKSEVMDIFNDWQTKPNRLPIEPDKLDFGLYGDHKNQRPYTNVVEGVNWYLNQEQIQHIPEELVLRLVAHNFGISFEDAIEQVRFATICDTEVVDLT